jgi:hypothetical protein
MANRTITVDHNGKTFGGEIMRIESTHLGWEDHGILTAQLHCKGDGSGIGVGGYCLDVTTGPPDYKRAGTAYGLDHLMRIMETVGVSSWEKLPGQQVIVLFEGVGSSLGRQSVGIAGMLNSEVLVLKEHAEGWHGREGVAS